MPVFAFSPANRFFGIAASFLLSLCLLPSSSAWAQASDTSTYDVVYISDETGHREIWTTKSADPTVRRQVSQFLGMLNPNWPRWSPDGEWITFDAAINSKSQIFAIRSDGSEAEKQLTYITGADYADKADFGNDPDWLYYMRVRPAQAVADIYRVNVETGAEDPDPVSQNRHIHSFDVADDGSLRLEMLENGCCWTPNQYTMLHEMQGDEDTGLSWQVIARDGHSEWHGRISPDNQKIVYMQATGAYAPHGLYEINADGTGRRTLIPAISSNNFFPAWDAEGERLVIEKQVNGSYDLYLLDLETLEQQVFLEGSNNYMQPDWLHVNASTPKKPVFGYYNDYGDSIEQAADIPYSYYTHVIYAFADLVKLNDEYNFRICLLEYVYHSDGTRTENCRRSHPLLNLKSHGVKVLVSIGGGAADKKDVEGFLASCEKDIADACISTVERLIGQVVNIGFDGVDVDLENFGKNHAEGYSNFLKYMKQDMATWEGQNLLLTTAIQPDKPSKIFKKYPVAALKEYADYIIVMGYDTNGGNSSKPNGCHSAITGILDELDDKDLLEKTVYAMPFYLFLPQDLYEKENNAFAFKDFDAWGDNEQQIALTPVSDSKENACEKPLEKKIFKPWLRFENGDEVPLVSLGTNHVDEWVWVNDGEAISRKVEETIAEYPTIGGFGVWQTMHDTQYHKLSSAIFNTLERVVQ